MKVITTMDYKIFKENFEKFKENLQNIELKYGLLNDLICYKNISLAIDDLILNYHNDAINYNLKEYIRLVESFNAVIEFINPLIKFPQGWGMDPLYHFKRDFSSFMHDIISQSLVLKISQKNMSQERKCFAPYDELDKCDSNIIGAHTISNGNNFRNKNIYTFDKVFFKKEIQYDSKLKNIHPDNASLGYIFCKNHDGPLFSKIEINSNIDLTNEEHHLLQNYRIFYKKYSEDKINIKANIQNKILDEFEIKYSQPPYNLIYLKTDINNFIIKEREREQYRTSKKLSYDIDSKSNDIFRKKIKTNLSYLVFTLKNDTKIFSSSCGMAKVINNTIKIDTDILYFHILQNKDNPCIIFSGIKTTNINNTLKIIEKKYDNDYTKEKLYFSKFICSFVCLTDNTFFTDEIFNHNELKKKFEDFYNEDNKKLFEEEDFFDRLDKNKLIPLTNDEASFLFSFKEKFKKTSKKLKITQL